MWYEWESLESFNTWHDQICKDLGIPDEHTLTYTLPFSVGDKIIAVVHQTEAEGLTPTDLRLPTSEDDDFNIS
jgi:hypothetical protein